MISLIFFAPKRGKSSTSNRLLSQNTMRDLSLVLASHLFVTLVNLSLFSYKFAIFYVNSLLFSFSSFLRSLAKARLISPNLPILMRCFCRLRTKFQAKFPATKTQPPEIAKFSQLHYKTAHETTKFPYHHSQICAG